MQKNKYKIRRKARHLLNRLLCVSLILLYLIFLQTMGVLFGLFHENTILEALNQSTYYGHLYEVLEGDMQAHLDMAGIPSSVMEGALAYESALIVAKQQVENDLAEGDYQADTGILTTGLEQNLLQYFEESSIVLTEPAQRGMQKILEQLKHRFSDFLVFPFVEPFLLWRAQWMQDIRQMVWIAVPLFFGTELILYFIQHYPSRAVRYNAYALGAAGLITTAGAAVCAIRNRYAYVGDYELSARFFQEYLARSLQIYLYIGVLAILFAAVLYGAVKGVNTSGRIGRPRSVNR